MQWVQSMVHLAHGVMQQATVEVQQVTTAVMQQVQGGFHMWCSRFQV